MPTLIVTAIHNANKANGDSGSAFLPARLNPSPEVRENQRCVGPVNPVSVDGAYFHNLKYIKEAYGSDIRIKSRTLTQRVADLKIRCGLQRSDTLVLNRYEFASLISRAITRLSFEAFKKALTAYIAKHDLQPVRGGERDDPASLDPITIERAYDLYDNNRAPIFFRCRVCTTNCEDAILFHKSLDHWARQGCPVCGDKRAVNKRRLPIAEVTARIAKHPGGIDLIVEESTYCTNFSPVTVVCRNGGHKITRQAQEFFEYGSFISCPYCACGRVGESLAIGVVNFLLDTGNPASKARELTPQHLSGWEGKGNLRHDGYFEIPHLALKIAVEHMGNQHINPDNPFHTMSRIGNIESFGQMKIRDEWKDAACKENCVSFVNIPDLVVNCSSLIDAAKLVTKELVAMTSSRVLYLPGFDDRSRQLDNENFVLGLISESGRMPPTARLQKQLDEESSPVCIAAFNPITNFFTLTCSKHPDQAPWPAKASNAIGSAITGRKGTRCPKCGPEKRGAARKLTEIALDAQASEYGFKKKFVYAIYKSNAQILPWECLKNPEHVIFDCLGHLRRRCKLCRDDADLHADPLD